MDISICAAYLLTQHDSVKFGEHGCHFEPPTGKQSELNGDLTLHISKSQNWDDFVFCGHTD